MSATNRTEGQRQVDDFYETPAWAVHRILEELFPAGQRASPALKWIDPCAGRGAIIRAAREVEVVGRFTAIELEATYEQELISLAQTVVMGDFFRVVPARYDVSIFNPAFPLAEQFVRANLQIADHVLCLQRLNWAAKRRDLLDEFPADVFVLPDRPAFGLNKHGKVGTDATEYAWFYWGPDRHKMKGSGLFDILPPSPKSDLKRAADRIRQVAGQAWIRAHPEHHSCPECFGPKRKAGELIVPDGHVPSVDYELPPAVLQSLKDGAE